MDRRWRVSVWGFSLFRSRPVSGAERAARWLRDKLEQEARGRYGWLDAGVWAHAAQAAQGVPRDTAQAAQRLTAASVIGDEIALGG